MSNFISISSAGVLALSLTGTACANDEKARDQPNNATMQDQGSPPAELSKQDQEYLAALKQCEGVQDAAKQRCIEQLRRKYNWM